MWNPLRPGIEPSLHWPGSELPGSPSLVLWFHWVWPMAVTGRRQNSTRVMSGVITLPLQLGHCKQLVSFHLDNSSCKASLPCSTSYTPWVTGRWCEEWGVTSSTTSDIANPDILQHPLLASPRQQHFKVFCIKLSSIIPSEWGGHLFPAGTKTGTVCPPH